MPHPRGNGVGIPVFDRGTEALHAPELARRKANGSVGRSQRHVFDRDELDLDRFKTI